MAIEIISSTSTISNLTTSYRRLSSEYDDVKIGFESRLFEELIYLDGATDGIQIVIDDHFQHGEFYSKMSKKSGHEMVAIFDNGSTECLSFFNYEDRLKLTVVAAQRHCCTQELINLNNKDIYFLTDLRSNLERIEAKVRALDKVMINLNCLSSSCQIGVPNCYPSGLTIEEFCLIGKFIGAAQNVTQLIICGLDPKNDQFQLQSKSVSLFLWYLIQGFSIRNSDLPIDAVRHDQFTVLPDGYNLELVFIRSISTGRWWLKVKSEDGDYYHSCTKYDYEMARKSQLTDELLKIYGLV